MNLIAAVFDDAEGVDANASLSNKVLVKLSNLLSVLKEAANDLRILSINVLEKLVNFKSMTDKQLIQICEALLETSDKS